jgi:hypothetical protein
VAQLVQCPPGVHVKLFGCPPYDSHARPLVRSRSRPATARVGRRSPRKTGPLVRPASRRGSSWADPVCQNTHSTAPPLLCTRARRLARSRSSTSKASSSLARAAVSYSSRHRVRSRSGRSRRTNSRSSWPRVRARVRSIRSRRRSKPSVGSTASHPQRRHHPTAVRTVASPGSTSPAPPRRGGRETSRPASGRTARQPRPPGRGQRPSWRARPGRPAGWTERDPGDPRRPRRQPGGSPCRPEVARPPPRGPPLLAVATNAGSSSVPPGRDSPGHNIIDERSPQQIGCLLR